MFDMVEDDIEVYAETPDEAVRESSRRNLKRMFPNLDEEEFIELEDGNLMQLTLGRVMETMLHATGPTFSMNNTFDNEIFYKAKEEAYDLMLWIDSEDGTPKPDSLKYKAPHTESDESEDTEIKRETNPQTGEKKRKPRGISPNSRYQQSIPIVKEAVKNGQLRKDTIQHLMETFNLPKPTAESYYSKAKSES